MLRKRKDDCLVTLLESAPHHDDQSWTRIGQRDGVGEKDCRWDYYVTSKKLVGLPRFTNSLN